MGVTELLIVLTIILLVFGAKRLPQLGRSLGRGVRDFRVGMAEASGEGDDAAELRARKNEAGEKPLAREAGPGRASDAEGGDEPPPPGRKP